MHNTRLKTWLLKRVKIRDYSILTAKSIYILPTREGIMYAVLVIIMLAAAINFNNALVFFFTFLLVGIGLVSMHMTQKNLLGLHCSIAHVAPEFCGQTIQIPLIIKAHDQHHLIDKKFSHFSIEVTPCTEHSNNNTQTENIIDIVYNDKNIIYLAFPGQQRGYLQLPPLVISTDYPLGFFRAWANIQLTSDAIVYPEPARSFAHKAKTGAGNDNQGSSGRGFDDFSGFKIYQTGEPLSHIHWKAYAREQGLLSKTFSGANNYEYWLSWHELEGSSEQRLSLLCRLIINAQIQGDKYGLILPQKSIAIGQGEAHQHHCLKALALYQV